MDYTFTIPMIPNSVPGMDLLPQIGLIQVRQVFLTNTVAMPEVALEAVPNLDWHIILARLF
jgi:hypothetical protein